MKKYLELIRIKHWIKNALIFIPIICAGLINYNNILKAGIGFIAFSLMCSFIYIINDIRDVEKDKLHPRKKKRPLPSGKITKTTAMIIAVVLVLLSIIINVVVNNSLINTFINYYNCFSMQYSSDLLLFCIYVRNNCFIFHFFHYIFTILNKYGNF